MIRTHPESVSTSVFVHPRIDLLESALTSFVDPWYAVTRRAFSLVRSRVDVFFPSAMHRTAQSQSPDTSSTPVNSSACVMVSVFGFLAHFEFSPDSL